MKKLYEKNELSFALIWIGIYCFAQSLANPISAVLGTDYLAQALVSVVIAALLSAFIKQNGLSEYYGLCKSAVPVKKLLWYMPLLLLASSNLWYGVEMKLELFATCCYLLTMLLVGFLEELIFRGLLFKAMWKDNVSSAIIISSITFGIGHLLNLVNGSGMTLVANLCQVFGAIAIGFMFVTLFYRSGSLIPCILTHSAINMLSAFANEGGMDNARRIVQSVIIIVIAVVYTLLVEKNLRGEQ